MLNVVNVVLKEAFFYPHWGLGDAIICNGLMRELAKHYQKSYVLCKASTFESVAFMVRDYATAMGIVDEQQFGLIPPQVRNRNVVEIGYSHFDFNDYPGHPSFCRSFYNQFNVDFEKRWTNFHVVRDSAREQALFDKLDIREDYIFVHSDPARGYNIKPELLPSNIRIIHADAAAVPNIFDYMLVLERAKEIHLIESAFEFLVDSYDHWTADLYIHRYARSYPNLNRPELRANWKIL